MANLILNGVDARRTLLMTFSRRAASEMGRRVEVIEQGPNLRGVIHVVGGQRRRGDLPGVSVGGDPCIKVASWGEMLQFRAEKAALASATGRRGTKIQANQLSLL